VIGTAEVNIRPLLVVVGHSIYRIIYSCSLLESNGNIFVIFILYEFI